MNFAETFVRTETGKVIEMTISLGCNLDLGQVCQPRQFTSLEKSTLASVRFH